MNQTFIILAFLLAAVIYHLGPWETEHSGPIGVDQQRQMIDVEVSNWTKEVVGSHRPVLVFFHSPSSGDCQRLYPALTDVNEMLNGKVKFTRIELASNASLAMQYQVQEVPSLVMFRDGLKVETLDDSSTKDLNSLEAKLLNYCD